jgi:hypothetical protein
MIFYKFIFRINTDRKPAAFREVSMAQAAKDIGQFIGSLQNESYENIVYLAEKEALPWNVAVIGTSMSTPKNWSFAASTPNNSKSLLFSSVRMWRRGWLAATTSDF